MQTLRNKTWSPQLEEAEEAISPEHHVGIKVLRQAVDDLKILCGYGLITRKGRCKPWPLSNRGKCRKMRHGDYMVIAGMGHPLEHERLRDWFLNAEHGQLWCDLIGWRMPCAEIFWHIVRTKGAKK
jgi:hypothetical protein